MLTNGLFTFLECYHDLRAPTLNFQYMQMRTIKKNTLIDYTDDY